MNVVDKIKNIIKSIVVLGAIIFAWLVYSDYDKKSKEGDYSFPEFKETLSDFECRGKVNCSEMASCEEAKYYLHNCPDSQLDPDGDGIPCETGICANE